MHQTAAKLARRFVLALNVAAASAGFSDTLTWVGETGNWSEAANWRNGSGANAVPVAGDDVVIDSAVTVTLDLASSTPALKSLTVGGGAVESKLVFAKWDVALVATMVVVANKGVLTCQGAYEKENMGRVWIQCTDLTVVAGGKIDVDECGYLAAEMPASGYLSGYGPGRASTDGMGASHGGLGGLAVFSDQKNPLRAREPDFSDMLYDDPEAPVEPGSSGYTSQYAKGGAGGGAVRIEATGRVTVNGAILASGGGVVQEKYWSNDSHHTGGSGGSVYITCETFAGDGGTILADGGNGHYALSWSNSLGRNSIWGYDPPNSYGDSVGGGGMIAICYAVDKQTDGLVKNMTISAAPGFYASLCRNPNPPTRADEDRYFCQGDLGTLHFSDDRIVRTLLGKGLSGRISGYTEWTCDELDFTSGFVRFMGEGFKLKVNGDLTVSGKNVRLDVGGVAMTNRVFRPEVWAGRTTVAIEVGGDLTVSDGARLDIRSAATNQSTTVGSVVTVGKTLTVGENGNLYAWCEYVNGGAPKFSVSNLTVAAGGLLSAEGRGYAGAAGRANGSTDTYWNHTTSGYGPGKGFIGQTNKQDYPDGTQTGRPATGGTHGGKGGLSTLAYGSLLPYVKTYDDPWRPTMPGSGGGATSMAFGNGAGGGVIYVEAADHIQVDGTVNADGGRTWSLVGPASGGSGGTIFLSSKTFSGAATGVLTARGGDIGKEPSDNTRVSGAGGGGRIAVWTGEAYPGKMTSRRVQTYETAASCPGCDFLGTVTAGGGVNDVSSLPEMTGATLNGSDGTVGFAYVEPPKGLLLLFR